MDCRWWPKLASSFFLHPVHMLSTTFEQPRLHVLGLPPLRRSRGSLQHSALSRAGRSHLNNSTLRVRRIEVDRKCHKCNAPGPDELSRVHHHRDHFDLGVKCPSASVSRSPQATYASHARAAGSRALQGFAGELGPPLRRAVLAGLNLGREVVIRPTPVSQIADLQP